MANRSQLPVEEIGTQTAKIRFINVVNYCCVDGSISRGHGSNTNGMSSSVSIRNTFKIAVTAGGGVGGKLSLTVILFSLYDNPRPISGV